MTVELGLPLAYFGIGLQDGAVSAHLCFANGSKRVLTFPAPGVVVIGDRGQA